MTRRPVKKRSARKAPARKRPARKSRGVAARPDALDGFIAAGARALDLKIDKAWMPAVRTNLEVTLRLGAMVAAFPLPDDAEPASVFVA